jgi:hypothetical protein
VNGNGLSPSPAKHCTQVQLPALSYRTVSPASAIVWVLSGSSPTITMTDTDDDDDGDDDCGEWTRPLTLQNPPFPPLSPHPDLVDHTTSSHSSLRPVTLLGRCGRNGKKMANFLIDLMSICLAAFPS